MEYKTLVTDVDVIADLYLLGGGQGIYARNERISSSITKCLGRERHGN